MQMGSKPRCYIEQQQLNVSPKHQIGECHGFITYKMLSVLGIKILWYFQSHILIRSVDYGKYTVGDVEHSKIPDG